MKYAIPALAILALSAAACGGGETKTETPAPTAAPATTAAPAAAAPTATTAQTAPAAAASAGPTAAEKAEAESTYNMRCTPCHGSSGQGDGAAAAALNPKPRKYSDKAWQAATTDEAIAKAIVGGGPAVGLSALMPPNPDLAAKPGVVQALVDKIRGFAK